MKNTRKFILTVIMILMLIGIIQLMSPTIGNTLASILTTMTTMAGLFSVFFELRKSADISECTFIFELQKYFNQTESIQTIFDKLDDLYSNNENRFNKSDRKNIINYLTFFETFCDLLNKGAFQISDIDGLFAYSFFLGTNSKVLQDRELNRFPEYYPNIYKTYPFWLKYRIKNNGKIPFNDTPLIK